MIKLCSYKNAEPNDEITHLIIYAPLQETSNLRHDFLAEVAILSKILCVSSVTAEISLRPRISGIFTPDFGVIIKCMGLVKDAYQCINERFLSCSFG